MIGAMAVATALPFGAAVVAMLFGRRLPPAFRQGAGRPGPVWNGAAIVAVAPIALATSIAAVVAAAKWGAPVADEGRLATVPTGAQPIEISLYLDRLSAGVALMVCCVALAVQVYSVAYMADDPRYPSYSAFVSLFTSAMLLVVLAGDLLVLYVGWEVMGVCSYFLIGHYWYDRPTSRAAVKAFLVNRVGDVGFLFGIFVLGLAAGSFSVRHLIETAGRLPDGVVLAGTLLLLVGVAGKSAQFPLHTWLPDAMAGPTPISALIHAATMVAAGVYVVARLFPAFAAAPASLAVLGVMAAISMLGAALAALAQNDLKRVLAYSTVSQLAYMAAGLSAGARDGAIFHLLTHGAFKALLFLGAGCVITVVGSNMLGDMGGLRPAPGRRGMPITFWSMTAGWAALVGLPPTSGYFSKDVIIGAAGHALGGGSTGTLIAGSAWLVYLSALATVAVTAAYATRAWLMTFFGEARTNYAVREAGPLMSYPVAVLAVPSLLLGGFGAFAFGDVELAPEFVAWAPALVLAGAGAAAAYLVWNADPALDPARRLGRARRLFDRAFFVDEAYDLAVVRPARALARVVVGVDTGVVDAAVEGSGRAARRLGGLLRVPHNGNPQAYVTGVLAGVVIIAMAVAIMGVGG
jgi:NADH-quinone oxidoreductase subunit L